MHDAMHIPHPQQVFLAVNLDIHIRRLLIHVSNPLNFIGTVSVCTELSFVGVTTSASSATRVRSPLSRRRAPSLGQIFRPI